ncbi:MAG: hypothetical protein QOJ02_3100 [Acidobacteriota bacterium]|jgi:hypothetical protein|nr:hypothetical protein [Acidobacteriota bacterium]
MTCSKGQPSNEVGWPLLKRAERYMSQVERISETITTYRKHGWRLERALLRPETLVELTNSQPKIFEDATLQEATLDALWFARPSHAGREAWELRLVAETPYALFETFEMDEAEEDREEVRREMEARLSEHAARS